MNDVRGKIPTFGYPLLTYSPSGSGRMIFDKKAWIHSRVSDGKAVVEENTGKIKVFSTAEIKQKLVQVKADGDNPVKKVIRKFPEGLKEQFSKSIYEDFEENYTSGWRNIYKLSGLQNGQRQ